ncbi:DUF6655 family protein [Azospirillum canadense]|uniref:DUF6655 family protein n=1 Tax=Azospirillum canadense TaxID=403962 RepID=UPI0022268603|nr:DUF6655 family protein [Azospirillum canadense]MCW2241900.1 hypothetical protein [Azospirillum canadense]
MPRNTHSIAALIALAALATACTDVKESLPSRTATEQLLIASAADSAANRLKLDLSNGRKAFVDTSNFEGTDAKYAASAIKESLLRQGIRLTDDKGDADTIIEIRLGALSVDQSKTVLGIPPITLPGTITLPEASVYSSTENQAVAKFSAFAYDRKSGEMVAAAEPAYGLSGEQSYRAMSLFSWRTSPQYAEDPK